MNNWLFFALLAPTLWALTNVMDGALRRNFIKNDMALTWMTAVSRLPFVILLFIITGFKLPSIPIVFLMMFAGILWTLPMFFYYKALKEEDPSRVSLLIQLVPIFTLPIAFLAIHERLTSFQIIAFVLLIVAGALAGIKKFMGSWRFSKAFFMIAISCFLWAISDVIFKKIEPSFPNFLSAFAVDFLGGFLVSFFIFFTPKNKSKILSAFSNLPIKAWIMIILSVISGIVGGLSFNYALTLGKASLTSVLMGIQPLLVLALGLLLKLFVKEISKEDIGLNALLFKGLSFAFVIAGLILLQF